MTTDPTCRQLPENSRRQKLSSVLAEHDALWLDAATGRCQLPRRKCKVLYRKSEKAAGCGPHPSGRQLDKDKLFAAC